MLDTHTAGRYQQGKPLDFLIVHVKEAIIKLITTLCIDFLERIVYILNQERGIEVSLDFRAIRHRVPAFAEVLLRVSFRQMVELACLYGKSIDFLERAAGIKYLSLERRSK